VNRPPCRPGPGRVVKKRDRKKGRFKGPTAESLAGALPAEGGATGGGPTPTGGGGKVQKTAGGSTDETQAAGDLCPLRSDRE